MLRRPPGHTLTDTLFPSTTPFRSRQSARLALYEAEFEKLKAAGRAIPAWQPEAPVPLVEFGHTPAVLIFMPAIDIITHRQQEQTVIHAALPVAGRDLAQPPACRPRLVQPVRQGERIGEVLLPRGKTGPDRYGRASGGDRGGKCVLISEVAVTLKQ